MPFRVKSSDMRRILRLHRKTSETLRNPLGLMPPSLTQSHIDPLVEKFKTHRAFINFLVWVFYIVKLNLYLTSINNMENLIQF